MSILIFVDIDGTLSKPGHRMQKPPPKNQKRGDLAYEAWLEEIQNPEEMLEDPIIDGMRQFVNRFNEEEAFYLTSRHEKYRVITRQWLTKMGFPHRKLFMRPENDFRPSSEFKSDLVARVIQKTYKDKEEYPSVIVIDDDQKGEIEKVCKEKGWTFLKARSGGKAY